MRTNLTESELHTAFSAYLERKCEVLKNVSYGELTSMIIEIDGAVYQIELQNSHLSMFNIIAQSPNSILLKEYQYL